MATAGQRLLDASGYRNLGSSGNQRNSDGTDTCACTSCADLAGPTTAEVTIAGANVCFTGCDGGGNGTLTGTAISGTWTLTRVRPPTSGGALCQYEGTFAYTSVQANLHSGSCATAPIVCSTTHIFIRLLGFGGFWELSGKLVRDAALPDCDCGGGVLVSFSALNAFDAPIDFVMDDCGATATGTLIDNCLSAFTGGTCATGVSGGAGELTTGGTFTVTI